MTAKRKTLKYVASLLFVSNAIGFAAIHFHLNEGGYKIQTETTNL